MGVAYSLCAAYDVMCEWHVAYVLLMIDVGVAHSLCAACELMK